MFNKRRPSRLASTLGPIAAWMLMSLVLTPPITAAGAIGIQLNSPVWCMGEKDGKCVTFLGDENTCANVTPCKNATLARVFTPVAKGDLFWCYGLGANDRCQLFLGSREACDNLSPCIFELGFLDREYGEKYHRTPAAATHDICCDAQDNCAPAPPPPGVCPSGTITSTCDEDNNCVDQD